MLFKIYVHKSLAFSFVMYLLLLLLENFCLISRSLLCLALPFFKMVRYLVHRKVYSTLKSNFSRMRGKNSRLINFGIVLFLTHYIIFYSFLPLDWTFPKHMQLYLHPKANKNEWTFLNKSFYFTHTPHSKLHLPYFKHWRVLWNHKFTEDSSFLF